MVESAGFTIFHKSSVLLVHPTGKPWKESFSIPKGHVEDGESLLKTAWRETYEETSIKVPPKLIRKTPFHVDYITKEKRVHYFNVIVDNISEIGLDSEQLPKKDLELKEVDWAGFVPFDLVPDLISINQKPIITPVLEKWYQ